jgi:hypothetical protein
VLDVKPRVRCLGLVVMDVAANLLKGLFLVNVIEQCTTKTLNPRLPLPYIHSVVIWGAMGCGFCLQS